MPQDFQAAWIGNAKTIAESLKIFVSANSNPSIHGASFAVNESSSLLDRSISTAQDFAGKAVDVIKDSAEYVKEKLLNGAQAISDAAKAGVEHAASCCDSCGEACSGACQSFTSGCSSCASNTCNGCEAICRGCCSEEGCKLCGGLLAGAASIAAGLLGHSGSGSSSGSSHSNNTTSAARLTHQLYQMATGSAQGSSGSVIHTSNPTLLAAAEGAKWGFMGLTVLFTGVPALMHILLGHLRATGEHETRQAHYESGLGALGLGGGAAAGFLLPFGGPHTAVVLASLAGFAMVKSVSLCFEHSHRHNFLGELAPDRFLMTSEEILNLVNQNTMQEYSRRLLINVNEAKQHEAIANSCLGSEPDCSSQVYQIVKRTIFCIGGLWSKAEPVTRPVIHESSASNRQSPPRSPHGMV